MGLSTHDLKPLRYASEAAKKELKESVPDVIRKRLGFQLKKVQLEIRVQDETGGNTGRCFYIAKFAEAIWVLHSFVKKTQKTSQRNIKIGQQRLKQVQEARQDGKD